ncbi:ATP dependent DNA ligase domain-containing protein [Nonomuraea wenchangensis]|uniref:ATP dependent DNA ligase domain-containing protein n=2 Tax=Nonomuraea wenchangensis TaxID=568860 RepID=A0A1I0L8G8_9ACTN|nr:ATP dependent DNA ligase domain-containing protein [Nonomuraea wenchangensis]
MRLRSPIEPMLAKAVADFPPGRPGAWRYEPKFDGFRGLALVDSDRGVHLQSRRGARLTDTFPEIVWAVFEHIPARTVLDGEIVRWAAGQLDFSALHRRNIAGRRRAPSLATSEPCHYAVFDVLKLRGRDVTGLPLHERRALLEGLFTTIPSAGVLALGLQTTDEAEARTWYETLALAGVEGLVIKPTRSTYEVGARGWLKLKRRTSMDAVVGGFVGSPLRPSGLILGRYDDAGRLRVVGRTTQLAAQAAAEVAPLLTPARAGHPWPETLPPGWASSPYGGRGPITYTQVPPNLVDETGRSAAIRPRNPLVSAPHGISNRAMPELRGTAALAHRLRRAAPHLLLRRLPVGLRQDPRQALAPAHPAPPTPRRHPQAAPSSP